MANHPGFPTFDKKTRGEIKHYLCLEIAREYYKRGFDHCRELNWTDWKREALHPCKCSMIDRQPFYYDGHHDMKIINIPETCAYSEVNKILECWAGGSDNSMQNYTKEILIDRKRNRNPKPGQDTYWPLIIKIIYDMTQEHLRINNIRYVKLYRGMSRQLMTLKPLSSFSVSKDVSKSFGASSVFGAVYEASIPARFIASTYFTGYGCAEEYEYVVLGMGEAVRHIKRANTELRVKI